MLVTGPPVMRVEAVVAVISSTNSPLLSNCIQLPAPFKSYSKRRVSWLASNVHPLAGTSTVSRYKVNAPPDVIGDSHVLTPS